MRFLNIWLFVFIAGLFFAGLMLYTTPETLRKREVAQRGRLVEVYVTRLFQVHLGKTHSYYLHFLYQNHKYSINIARNELESLVVGQRTALRHLDKYQDLFLMPGETLRFEFVPCILIFLFGIYGAVYSMKRLIAVS